MKRRIFAAVLSAAMILSLAACGGGGSSSSNPGSSSSGVSSSQPDASNPDASIPDASIPDGSNPDGSNPDGSAPDASTPDAATPDGSASGSAGGSASSSEGAGSSSSSGDSSKPGSPVITLNKTSVKLTKAGATFNLRYTIEPKTDAKVTFTSSDEKVATVNSKGVITAVAPGKADITAKCDGAESVTASVECSWKEENSSSGSNTGSTVVKLNSSSITLSAAGETYQLTATVEPKSSQKLEFYSSNPKVATVSADGLITAVAPGKVTITVNCGGASAIASVNCSWTETATPPAKNVDLSAFYSTITGKYEFGFLELADSSILDNVYPGLSGISAEQMLVYVCMISMNNGEFGLVQVKDSKDVDAVKAAFQARIDYMVGDGNGPGGAQYPMAMDQWENNSRIVSNGNYVMMIVHENCDDIVNEFNALF